MREDDGLEGLDATALRRALADNEFAMRKNIETLKAVSPDERRSFVDVIALQRRHAKQIKRRLYPNPLVRMFK